jgi:tetratricopeptide (TPR) repeat protein
LAVFLGGCGSEQSVQQSDPGQDTVSPSPVAESPAIPDPEPAATGPVVEPLAANDPLEPTLDAALPSSTGADSEESVDDILAELNAVKLEGEGDSSLTDPDKVVALITEGNALISAGKADAALAKYNEALKFAENGEDPEVFFNRGIAYKVMGEIDKAAAEYERALEVTPKYAEALNNLGNIRKDQKQYDEAIRCLELSIEVFPDNPNTYNNLGTVFAMKGNFNKAALYFTKAVRLQPSYIDARQNLGQAYQKQGRLNVAEKEFGEVLQMTKGMMLHQKKRLEAARVMVDQAKKPGSPLTFEQRNNAGGELDAAEQASRMANAKYQRSLKLLQSVRVRR